MRLISSNRLPSSNARLCRSLSLFVSFAYCTETSRILCKTFSISLCAPSTVSTKDQPSKALQMAWSVPRISALRRDAIETPAASSDAELIRAPDDSHAIDFPRSRLALATAAAASMVAVLIPITIAIFFSFSRQKVSSIWAR